MNQVYAKSSIGSSHIKQSIPCQDYSLAFKGNDYVCLITADGLGSAKYSQIGSRVAAKYLMKLVKNNPDVSLDLAMCQTKEYVTKVARRLGTELEELATTLQAVVIKQKKLSYAIIGDGAIVYTNGEGEHKLLTDEVEYAEPNMTNELLMDNLPKLIKCGEIDGEFTHVSSMTDGLLPLTIDYTNNQPHKPFFDYYLTQAKDSLSVALTGIVDSELAKKKVNDDRTLATAIL